MLKKLEISGLRGFATKQQLLFAQPTGVRGSGLTVIVGANNSGKSTTVDALRALTYQRDHTFSQEQRNFEAGDHIEIIVTDPVDKVAKLASIRQGSPHASHEDMNKILHDTIVVPSRHGAFTRINRAASATAATVASSSLMT